MKNQKKSIICSCISWCLTGLILFSGCTNKPQKEEMIQGLVKRDFAYADIFRHSENDPETAKNESNCTVFLKDGTWFTTWGQGGHEGHPDERIVYSISKDMGKTWSEPRAIQKSVPEKEEHIAYGIPFVVPETGRIYVFFFLTVNTEGKRWASGQELDWRKRRYPEHGSGNIHFIYSDDYGKSWSKRRKIDLPNRDINAIPGRYHGWINHPPQIMPAGEVIFTFAAAGMIRPLPWQLGPSEGNIVCCQNILTENNPAKLRFQMYPEGPRGIYVDVNKYGHREPLNRLIQFFKGNIAEHGFSFEELTVVPLSNDRWLTVGRTKLGSPCFSISEDGGQTWTSPEPLRYAPDGEIIKHPMTMCPIAKTSDGRIVLLFCNNDGNDRGAKHIWDGDGRTRNPQWIIVGQELAGETRNGGLVFGKPIILAEVDTSGETNLKTGISMPQFFERNGRYFVCYNINKHDILLDEIPKEVMDELTPSME